MTPYTDGDEVQP